MLDLPFAYSFAIEQLKKQEQQKLLEKRLSKESEETQDAEKLENEATLGELSPVLPPKDPISHLAEIAGYDNSELWWEHNFE